MNLVGILRRNHVEATASAGKVEKAPKLPLYDRIESYSNAHPSKFAAKVFLVPGYMFRIASAMPKGDPERLKVVGGALLIESFKVGLYGVPIYEAVKHFM